MKYSLRSLMTFSIRDLALVTVIVAVCVAWWLDRSRLLEHVRSIETKLDLETSRADATEGLLEAKEALDEARANLESNQAAWKADLESAQEAARRYVNPSLPEGHLLGPTLPESSAPAPNPPKK